MTHLPDYIAYFFTGALLCNSVPHLVSGLQGSPFPTPFAKPPGVGDSSPLVNFLWGAFNLGIGLFLLSWRPVAMNLNPGFITMVVGFLALGLHLSVHFHKVRQGRSAK